MVIFSDDPTFPGAEESIIPFARCKDALATVSPACLPSARPVKPIAAHRALIFCRLVCRTHSFTYEGREVFDMDSLGDKCSDCAYQHNNNKEREKSKS